LCNDRRNVVGMMPHPERACEAPLGSVDGRVILDSIVRTVHAGLTLGQAAAAR
jgi:phosphoribosylformylglycinamidine synthase